mgnify:CR=1 FL=1
MLTKKIYDKTNVDEYGDIFEFDLGDTSGIINYDLSGGSSDPSRVITLYGRIPGDNVTATDISDATSTWAQLVQFSGLDAGDSGGQLLLLYPSVKVRITGNSGSRVRVWVGYRQGLGCK